VCTCGVIDHPPASYRQSTGPAMDHTGNHTVSVVHPFPFAQQVLYKIRGT
jgi:hypothetical protein